MPFVIARRLFPLMFALLAVATPLAGGQCGNIPPVAEFTYSPIFPHSHEEMIFDASSSYDPDGYISNFTWDFGDGNITVIATSMILHSYEKGGEYTVTLLVTDNLGATNSTKKVLFVKAGVLASFSHSPIDPRVYESVTFDASNSTADESVIVTYAWDFGDGNTSMVDIPITTHSYVEAGLYTVILNVTDLRGEWATASEVVNVTESPKVAPKAAFTWLPEIPEADQPVDFNASDSTPDGGEIVSYAWDFGDGTLEVAADPLLSHTYHEYGRYVVLLNVTDSDGYSNATNHSITVVAKPYADFFFNPAEPRVYGPVTFNASTSDPRGGYIVSYEWNFGDESPAQFGVVTTHQFAGIGEYTVSLNVTDSENMWDVVNLTVKVLPHIADLNEDGTVNILDLAIFAKAYGSVPGHDRWNPRADLDGNKIVNILDGVVIARSYNMLIDPFDC